MSPDSFRIDTGFADSIASTAQCAADCCDVAVELNAGEASEVTEIDLADRLRTAMTNGDIAPSHAYDALAFVLQAVCSVASGDISQFFREGVAINIAELVRADSPMLPVWVNPVQYPNIIDDVAEASEADDLNSNDVDISANVVIPVLHRLGAMLTNLKCEPFGVSEPDGDDGSVTVLSQWSIEAAVTAFLAEVPDVSADPDISVLATGLILALADLLSWLDAQIMPGLAEAGIQHLLDDIIAHKVRHILTDVHSTAEEAA